MCCGKWSVCRFCHDEESDHHVNRHATQQMMCMHCNLIQPVAQTCVGCQQLLGRYYCDVCKLWDSDPKKNIYHCDKCGICRIGKGLGQDYFHCDKCNVCMAIHLKDNHRCIERNLESDCPICGEYMFTSTHTVIFMVYYLCSSCLIETQPFSSRVVIVSIGGAIKNTSKAATSAQSVGNHWLT